MKNVLSVLVTIVQANSKALAGFVVAALVGFLASKGVLISEDASAGLQAFLVGLVVALGVWIAPRNK